MQKEEKKKEETKTNQIITNSILKIDDLRKKINENKSDVNAKKFFQIVKSTFGNIFGIHYQYTYEELLEKLNTIDRKLRSISFAIERLKDKIDNTFSEEKDNPNLKEKIDEFEEKLRKEYDIQKFYMKLKSILSHQDIFDKTNELSQKISELEYSNQEITNAKITQLMDTFMTILHKIMDLEKVREKKKKKGLFVLLFGSKKQKVEKIKIEEPELTLKPIKNIPPPKQKLVPKTIKSKEKLTLKPTKPKEKIAQMPKERIPDTKKDVINLPKVIEKRDDKNIVKRLPTYKKVMRITRFIDQIKEMVNKNEISKAKYKYLKLLKFYKKLTTEEKEDVYRQLLQLYHSIIHADMSILQK